MNFHAKIDITKKWYKNNIFENKKKIKYLIEIYYFDLLKNKKSFHYYCFFRKVFQWGDLWNSALLNPGPKGTSLTKTQTNSSLFYKFYKSNI